MTGSEPSAVTLPGALIAYFEARTSAFLAARKTLGVGELDARALLFVSDNPGARPRDLGDHLGITSAGVTTLTDRLVGRQALRRDYDLEDRRVVRLRAIVDLRKEPWSALRRFDDAIKAASATLDRGDASRPEDVVAELTRIAVEATSSSGA